jgi:hypothetical protein
MRKRLIPWALSIAIVSATPLMAQTVVMERTQEPRSGDPAAGQAYQKMVGEVRARMAVEAKITPGAPYSAEAVTETTQVLADGNRINRKSVTRVYRDGEGRTRREDLDDNGTVVNISIVDPVAHLSYVLDPSSRSAYRDSFVLGAPVLMRSKLEAAAAVAPGEADAKLEAEAKVRQGGGRGRGMVVYPDGPPPPPPPPPLPGAKAAIEEAVSKTAVHEDLGTQTIEGVAANGSRATTTIPAGAIGNLQPIKVVSEQWLSPDLHVLVMTKHSDPRSGETTYRLQGLVRAEPDRSLFTVPADYTLKESGIRQPLMK